jgi:hypothetical protein
LLEAVRSQRTGKLLHPDQEHAFGRLHQHGAAARQTHLVEIVSIGA